jgi:4-amino-4-deoxy-L-arabinose transferase-like glycosyltransferase
MEKGFLDRLGTNITQFILLFLAGIFCFSFFANIFFSIIQWIFWIVIICVVISIVLASKSLQITHQKWRDQFMKWELQAAVSIILIGSCLRILWSQFSSVEQSSDFAFYASMAEHVFRGEYMLTPRKQSGPALVGGFIYWLLGAPNINAVLLFQAVVSSLTLPLVYLGTKRLFGSIAAFCSLIIIAFNPESWVYVNLFGNEPYLAFLITAAWFLISNELGNNKLGRTVVYFFFAGFSLGLAQYMRATGSLVFFTILLLLPFTINRTPRCLISFTVGFILTIYPIISFNYQKLGIISVSPSQYSGMSLLIGTNIKTKGVYYGEFFDEIDQEIVTREKYGSLDFRKEVKDYAELSGLTLFEADWVLKDRIAAEIALHRLKTNGFQIAKIAIFFKIPVFWGGVSGYEWSLDSSFVHAFWPSANLYLFRVSEVFHRLCILLGTVSLVFLAKFGSKPARQSVAIYGAAALALGGLHMFVEIQSKYHYSIMTLFPIIAFGWLKYLDEFRAYLQKMPLNERVRLFLHHGVKRK